MPTVQPAGGHESRTRRRRGRRQVGTSLSEINVVPLVDVMLVLLIVFMVAAPMMQRGLAVNLPESRRADPLVSERLFVTVPLAFRTEGVVQVGDDTVQVAAVAERMRLEMLDRAEKEVFLRADEEITYRELISVMDLLKEAGVQEVGLVLDIPRDR